MRLEMKVKTYLNKEWLWVRPQAELDMATAGELKNNLVNTLSSGGYRNLWLDLSAVGFIDSSGLGVILGRYRDLQPLGGVVMITKPNEQVYRLLVAAGLHRIIEIDRPLSMKYSEEGI